MKKWSCVILALLLLCVCALPSAPAAFADEEDGGWLVITKSPSGETVNEGDDAKFISRARNYVGLVWLFISPDGQTVYENNQAEEAFPGLEMAGFEGEELELISIPYAMDGWYVQTRFLDSDGDAYLTDRAQITVLQGLVASPRVKLLSGGARLSPGESRTLTVEASSPGGDPLKYQWYRSYSAARNSGEAILGATEASYTPPEEIGQVFYYVGVWCIRGRDASTPIYTAPVAIVYTENAPSAAPEPTAAPTPAPTAPPNRGGPNPLIDSDSAVFTAAAALLILTLLAVSVTVLILHVIGKKQRRAEESEKENE